MTLKEICQKIQSLINKIFAADKELKELKQTVIQKNIEALNTLPRFVETIKEVAPLQIKYSGESFDFKGIKLKWHREYGIAESNDKPMMTSRNIDIESFITIIKSQLSLTLMTINNQKAKELKQIEKLEEIITTLKNLNKDTP